MSDEDVRRCAAGTYERVNALWEARKHEIFDGACGFSILSGPPTFRPPMLTIGTNPGFGATDHVAHKEMTWPPTSYIPTAQWHLARKLRSIFAHDHGLGLLDGAIQTNFNFFKSGRVDSAALYRWTSLPRALRTDLEASCASELANLVRVMEPRRILVLGIGPFKRHATGSRELLRDRKNKRDLVVAGTLFGRSALAVLHPTGCRVDAMDWPRAVEVIEEWRPKAEPSFG